MIIVFHLVISVQVVTLHFEQVECRWRTIYICLLVYLDMKCFTKLIFLCNIVTKCNQDSVVTKMTWLREIFFTKKWNKIIASVVQRTLFHLISLCLRVYLVVAFSKWSNVLIDAVGLCPNYCDWSKLQYLESIYSYWWVLDQWLFSKRKICWSLTPCLLNFVPGLLTKTYIQF